MARIFIPDAYKLDKGGNPVKVTAIETKEPGDCCGSDCCANIIFRGKDKSTGDDTVAYFFDGAIVVETYATYLSKKQSGTFNY